MVAQSLSSPWTQSIQVDTLVSTCIDSGFAVILEAPLQVRCRAQSHDWVMGGGGMVSTDVLLACHAIRTQNE